MLKVLAILATLIAWATARPGYLHGHHHHHIDFPILHHHHHEPLHVAKLIHVPAAISHQSSTIVHSHPIIKPVVVPIVKHVAVHPIIKTYHPAPIIKAYHPLHYDHHPFHHFDHFDHFDHHDFHHHFH